MRIIWLIALIITILTTVDPVFGDSDTLKIVAETSKETGVSNQVMEELYQNSNNGGLWVEIYGPKNPPLNEIVNYTVFLKYAPEDPTLFTGMLYFAYPDSYVKTYPLPDFLRKETVNNVEKWTSYRIAERLKASGLGDLGINTMMSTIARIPFMWDLISSQLPSMPTPPRNLFFDGVFYNDNDFDTLITPFPVGADQFGIKDINPPVDLAHKGPDNALCFILPTKFTDNRPAILDFFIATQIQKEKLTDLLPYRYRQTGEITIWIHPTGVNDKTEETFDGIAAQITDVTWPPEDIHDITMPIPVDVSFTNIGSQAQSFWIGYSVQDSTGKWWDAPPRQAVVTKPGESGTIQLQWQPPETAPQGAYTAKVALWEGRNFDTDLMEGEFDSRTKDNAFRIINSAREWTSKGYTQYLHNQYTEAIQSFDNAIEIDSKYARAWNAKGSALETSGKHEDAIKCINSALEIANNALEIDLQDAAAWDNKGLALCYLGNYDESIKAYDEAIRLDPNFANAWFNKGHALCKQGKYDDAIECLDEAIRLDPNYAEAWNNKGVTLKTLGKTTEASTAFAKAKELGYKCV